jgi:hypothetical protein
MSICLKNVSPDDQEGCYNRHTLFAVRQKASRMGQNQDGKHRPHELLNSALVSREEEEGAVPQQVTPQTLTKTIRSRFSLSEIDDLCFELGILPEEIPGNTPQGKARELVLYCQRHGRLPELIQRVAELRPMTETTEPSNMKDNQTEKTNRIALIWVPIIVALIALAGVIIAPLFEDKPIEPTSIPPQATDATINAASFDYAVTVRDNDTGGPISGAHIMIETGGGFAPKNGYTDSNGFVRISIDAGLVGTKGRLSVEVADYKRFMREIDLTLDEMPDEIRLNSE